MPSLYSAPDRECITTVCKIHKNIQSLRIPKCTHPPHLSHISSLMLAWCKEGTVVASSMMIPHTLEAPAVLNGRVSFVIGHFGHKTLRLRCRSVCRSVLRHFSTGSRKSRDTSDPRQFRRDTAPPVIRLKLGAEVSGHFGAKFVVPKCLVAEVSGCRFVTPPKRQNPSTNPQIVT